MYNIISFFRVKEWYDSKVPMTMAVLLYFFMNGHGEFLHNIHIMISYFFFVFFFLAFGYVINDYSDIEVDKLAGKNKIMATSMSRKTARLIVILVALCGIVPLLLIDINMKLLLTLALTYFLGTAYSMKPLRFKERGSLGLFTSSFAQRCSTLLVITGLLQVAWVDLLFWILINFLLGLRYILVHQIEDYETDLKAGVVTFATKHLKASKIAVYVIFAFDLICLCYLLLPIVISNQWILFIIAAYTLFSRWTYLALNRLMDKSYFLTFYHTPLEDFYNIYLVLIFLIILGTKNPGWFLVLCASLVYLMLTIKRKFELPVLYLKESIKGRRNSLNG